MIIWAQKSVINAQPTTDNVRKLRNVFQNEYIDCQKISTPFVSILKQYLILKILE